MTKKERVVVYVDGFNLYFGLKEAGLEMYRWLDLMLLSNNLLKPHQELVELNYFTSRVSNNPDKQKRQSTYLEALECKGANIYYGHYQSNSIECTRCGNIWATYNEKMTDVNIATHMLIDAYKDKYDMAMLISGDSDLVPPIREIHSLFKSKRVFVTFPPKRHNASIAMVAKGSMVIGRKKLLDSQLPDKVTKKDGFVLKKPKGWSE
ncbi:MAG: NYN domain-containing protein [Tenuifilaceae bacterium]|jgi:uncharacterized LabA/DUF88 family protein|nr:NYN domain-containing protein [Tenuifilaceae bacterium]